MNSEYETQSCTSSSNRQCSTCTTMCPPGTMLSGVCSVSSNKKCVKCDINYYKLLNDDSPCIACDNICNSGFELIETIWDNKCYGYVLDRVIIITLFTKDQQNLPLLSKNNINIITSYLLNDWKLEKINLMYKYEKDPDVVKYIME